MALYIPAGRRRRRVVVAAALALVIGLVAGVVVGKATAPSVGDRVRHVQSEARATASRLRVIAIHDESSTVSTQDGDAGAKLALEAVRRELGQEFDDAPWLSKADKDGLLGSLTALDAIPDRLSVGFATAAEKLASDIEATFGA